MSKDGNIFTVGPKVREFIRVSMRDHIKSRRDLERNARDGFTRGPYELAAGFLANCHDAAAHGYEVSLDTLEHYWAQLDKGES